MEQIRIGMAAAAAEESRPAVPTFFLIEHMGFPEVLRQLFVLHTIKDGKVVYSATAN